MKLVADDDNWYKTIVLAGVCACMPGLAGNCNHIVFIIISYLLLLWKLDITNLAPDQESLDFVSK